MDEQLRQTVRERGDHRCEYCCLPQDAEPFFVYHVEHIVARQHGGSDDNKNLALACYHCNAHKGPNLSALDPESGALVRLFNPRLDKWEEHFERNGVLIAGRTAVGRANNLSTIYITANFATYSPDLRRRLLALELFLEESRAEERAIKNFLDEDALINMRPRLLSVLWAFIKNWHAKGEPTSSKLLPSFEHWSNVVGGIVQNAGFSSPCQLATLKTGGDTDTQDMEKLVSEMNPGAEFRFGDLISHARDHHLFQRLIPAEGDMDKKQSTRMGFIVRKFVGRLFNGRFRFCLSEGTRKTERYYVMDLKKS